MCMCLYVHTQTHTYGYIPAYVYTGMTACEVVQNPFSYMVMVCNIFVYMLIVCVRLWVWVCMRRFRIPQETGLICQRALTWIVPAAVVKRLRTLTWYLNFEGGWISRKLDWYQIFKNMRSLTMMTSCHSHIFTHKFTQYSSSGVGKQRCVFTFYACENSEMLTRKYAQKCAGTYSGTTCRTSI